MKRGRPVLLILALVVMFYDPLLAKTLTITAPTGTVRAGPGKTYKIIGKVAKNEQYEVIDERGEWYKISLEGHTEGWVLGEVVALNQEQRGLGAVTLHQGQPGVEVSSTPHSGAVQRRFALVIGNTNYRDNPLRNPVNDATDMAALLRQLGFGVTLLRDADKRTMDEAIRTFTTNVPPNSAGLFYFSGHGVEIAGENYLIPVGGLYSQPSDVEYGAVKANWVLARMEDAGMRVKLIILDACRNSPFGRSWARGAEGGLAQMDAPEGTLIAYSTSPKKTAADGTGHNSPYTAHLLRQIPTPGQSVIAMFQKVRGGVRTETNGQQVPWESTSLYDDFYFKEAVQLGGLSILGRVSGAEVWVGADKIGETQAGRALPLENLKPGNYRVQARKPGYEPWDQEVAVLANQRTAVVVDIKPLPAPPVVKPEPVRKDEPPPVGALSIRSSVSGAEVWVGTDKIGETQASRALPLENLKPGNYRVQVRKPGYEPWDQEVEVLANQRTAVVVDIKLLPAPPAVEPEPDKPRVEVRPSQGRPLVVAPTP